jgi:hypothetical protein
VCKWIWAGVSDGDAPSLDTTSPEPGALTRSVPLSSAGFTISGKSGEALDFFPTDLPLATGF